jgi:hypothetical protein
MTLRESVNGVWRLQLISEADAGRRDVAAVQGEVALLPRGAVTPEWISLPRPTHIGVSNIDLNSLGIAHRNGEILLVGARAESIDSIEVVLNPAPDHGAVILRGRLTHDSIAGQWFETAYAGGRKGRFTMSRAP